MTHFAVLVLTNEKDDIRAAVDKLLAPYDENGEFFREGSRWDWWEVGGRWRNALLPFDHAPVSEVPTDIRVTAIVTPDGQWHERGRPGWWGAILDERPDDEWAADTARLLGENQFATAVVVDCHV